MTNKYDLLRQAYEKLARRLEKTGRAEWVAEEMAVLTDPAIYRLDPAQAWKRFKLRSTGGRFLAVLRELATWREQEAQSRDVPRNRILRDEAVTEIAAHAPRDAGELARTRGLGRSIAEGRQGAAILAAVRRAADLPEADCPPAPERREMPARLVPIIDLLRVLLKTKCESEGVAQRLVADADDLQMIAADDRAPVRAMAGWRHRLFGADALALKQGRLALTASADQVRIVTLAGDSDIAAE